MARPLVFALLLLGTLLRMPGAEVDELQKRVYVVSPYFLGNEESKFPKTAGGLIDLRGYLKIRDIEIPGNGEATYDPGAHRVTIRAAEDIIVRTDQVWADYGAAAVRITFTLVEFSASDSVDLPEMGYDQLRKLAGDSWRVRDRITLMAKSGQKVTSQMLGKNAATGKARVLVKPKDDPADGMISPSLFGTKVEMEPMIAPDGMLMDVSFAYACRIRAAPDQPPMLVQSQTNVTLMHNVPLVVQTATLTSPKGEAAHAPAKEVAVIVQASVIDVYGRNFTPEDRAAARPSDPLR